MNEIQLNVDRARTGKINKFKRGEYLMLDTVFPIPFYLLEVISYLNMSCSCSAFAFTSSNSG